MNRRDVPMVSMWGFVVLFLVFVFLPVSAYSAVRLVKHNGGFFSIEKPAGWQFVTAGSCTTFGFYGFDPGNSLNQIFFFGAVGPVYMNDHQKNVDSNYMRMGGYAIKWYQMPVIQPLTPENFIKHWNAIVSTNVARQFMQPLPQLRNLQVIHSQPSGSAMQNGQTALVRALFTKNNRVGEGLFLVTVVPFTPYTGGPGGGTAYGLMISGITAEKGVFASMEQSLARSLRSFYMSQDYINRCMQMQQQAYAGVMRAGQTLREASDIIVKGWEGRSRTYDIIAEKRSDAILEKERLYDPNTGEVYSFDNGFYDKYRLNPYAYNKKNLKPLPDNNYDLWTAAALDGDRHIHID